MPSVHVEADLYSGRKNPGWDLLRSDVTLFERRLASLTPDVTEKRDAADGLGYRGLRVTVRGDGVHQDIHVFLGNVTIVSATGDRRQASDPERAFEKWLIRTGKDYLSPEELRYVMGG